MANLTNCPTCNGAVSTEASACPHCGQPMPKPVQQPTPAAASPKPKPAPQGDVNAQVVDAMNTKLDMKNPLVVLGVLGVLAVGAVGAIVFVLGIEGGVRTGIPMIEWQCAMTGEDTAQCTISNYGSAYGQACFDMVAVCADGRHVANHCTGEIQAGETTAQVVEGFQPPITNLAICTGIEYQGAVVN